jgi:RNA polymerase sigma factor (sigma-70 family)
MPDLRDLQRGDERAWTRAFESLWRLACHAVLGSGAGLDQDESEDAAIEALTKLVSRIDTVTSADGLKALLVTIARRHAISLARRKAAAKRPEVAVHLDALPDHEAEHVLNRQGRGDARGETDAAELLALLHEALKGVDATTRELLLAQTVDGLTTRELAERFNLPPGTVSVKIMRGLQRIRQRLKESPGLMKELEAFLR